MSHKKHKRQVPIYNKTTGESTLSEPIQVRPPRSAAAMEEPVSTLPDISQQNNVVKSEESGAVLTTSESSQATLIETGADDKQITLPSEFGGKGKAEIETLEQFIEYAYSRKGQRIILKPKVEKQIVQSAKLDEAALERLLDIANRDKQLAVPRQLLLLSRDIVGFPTLRAAFDLFVSKVMFGHPVFSDAGVQGAMRNLPDAPSPAAALTKVFEFTPTLHDDNDSLKGAELQVLRRNAANLFVVWLANNRGMNFEELATLLFEVIWRPATQNLADDNARLRALTEVEQAAGVGMVCLRFRQQAIEARNAQEHALRDADDLRGRLAESESLRTTVEAQRDALEAELRTLREQTANEMAELRRKHADERTHLHHDHEQLGGRLVRRLDDAVETLEVGLTALRNKTPRVEVMLERAELVVDALRAEIKNLREE